VTTEIDVYVKRVDEINGEVAKLYAEQRALQIKIQRLLSKEQATKPREEMK